MRVFNLWVVVRPAEDLPDQWVAHCLELDVISQGTSFQHAMAMVGEAAFLAVTEDLSAGRDPLLRRAPDEFWTDLYSIAASGEQVPYASLLKGVDGDFVEAIASQMVLQV